MSDESIEERIARLYDVPPEDVVEEHTPNAMDLSLGRPLLAIHTLPDGSRYLIFGSATGKRRSWRNILRRGRRKGK